MNGWVKVVVVAGCLAVMGCESREADRSAPIPPGPYTVTQGDDLSNIALRAYGDMKYWYSLLNANPQLTKRPGFDLVPGETITVPPRDEIDMSLPESNFPKQLPADYIIMPANSLDFIAEGCYGDAELWPLIYEANRTKLSERVKEDRQQLIAGEVLHLPAKPSEGESGRAAEP